MSIISIVDYDGVNDFLIREESSLYNKRFSLIRVNEGRDITEIIALGTAEEIYKSATEQNKDGKQLLNE